MSGVSRMAVTGSKRGMTVAVETVALGEYLFKREPTDRKPYRVRVITKPENGVVGVQFSNGTVGTVDMQHLYPTWRAANEVPFLVARPRRSQRRPRADKAPRTRRWLCDCGALNLPGTPCWRCGKEEDRDR